MARLITPRRDALRLAAYFAGFGVLWVLGTDLLAERVALDAAELRRLSTFKGWFFVLVSAGFVYLLALRSAKGHQRSVRAAKDAEHRFRGLMEHAPDMVFWLAEPDLSKVHYASSALESMWGCPPERVYEDPAALLDFVHPDDHERFLTRRVLSRDGGLPDFEYRVVRPDGEILWMRSLSYPVRDEATGFELLAGVTQDVTRQKEASDELWRSDELHRRAQRLGRIGHWELDSKTRRLTWSDEVYRIFGVERGTFIPSPESFRERVHPEDRAAHVAADEAALAELGPLDIGYRIVRPDGEIRHVHERATIVEREGGTRKLVGTMQDITERRRLQVEVEASRDLLRRYAAMSIGDHERERISLAREFHDHIGQLLTAVKLQLGRQRRHAEGEQRERLSETMTVVDTVLEETRDISTRLRPPALDQLGLVDALDDYVAAFEGDTGLPASFATDFKQVSFDGEVSGHIFRIAQEALTNVARHSHADMALVELRSETGAILLRVLDDGVGLSTGSPEKGDRFGIIGMQERALLLGGSLEFVDRDPHGLEVRLRVPYTEIS